MNAGAKKPSKDFNSSVFIILRASSKTFSCFNFSYFIKQFAVQQSFVCQNLQINLRHLGTVSCLSYQSNRVSREMQIRSEVRTCSLPWAHFLSFFLDPKTIPFSKRQAIKKYVLW